jgi:hypothetical protein
VRTPFGSPFSAGCAIPVAGEVTQPQPGLWLWLAVCVVGAVLPALAEEAALFVCVTEPSSPGLSTRTEMSWFEGSTWVAFDAASAAWSVSADWVEDWTGLPANAVPALTAAAASEAASVAITRFIESSFAISVVSRAKLRAIEAELRH